MWDVVRKKRRVSVVGVLGIALLLLTSGCGALSLSRRLEMGSGYYLIDQTPCNQIKMDQEIIDCKSKVVSVLRERMNNARLGRTAGSFIQVVTAAMSAMFTGTAGASALGTATVLSGVSAIIPEISSVIEAKERAEVYSEGINMIENGYAVYLEQVATPKGDGESPSSGPISPAGAALYSVVVSAIHVVEKGFVGLLPTLEELQKARPEPLDVSARFVNLEEGSPLDLRATRGGPFVSALSHQPEIATAEIQEATNQAKIVAVRAGKTTVVLRNATGGIATVGVQVTGKPAGQ